jgi:hypothetical protein
MAGLWRSPNAMSLRRLSIALTLTLCLWACTTIGAKPEEQAVIVHVPLSDAKWGTKADFDHFTAVEDELQAAIAKAKCGEYDGNEIGQGEFVFFMYGPDADRLFSIVGPILRRDERVRAGFAILRYGPPDAKSRRIELQKKSEANRVVGGN